MNPTDSAWWREAGDDRVAERRAQYLRRKTPWGDDDRRSIPLALAYRRLGYSRSGIAKRVGVTEATVVTYLEAVKETFGAQAVETAHPDQLAAWPDCPFFPEVGRDER